MTNEAILGSVFGVAVVGSVIILATAANRGMNNLADRLVDKAMENGSHEPAARPAAKPNKSTKAPA